MYEQITLAPGDVTVHFYLGCANLPLNRGGEPSPLPKHRQVAEWTTGIAPDLP